MHRARLLRLTVTGETGLAAVIGDPVRHSRSPAIHNAAFRASGVDAVYVAFTVDEDATPAAVDAMRRLGWLGLSVTMPCKAAAAAAVDRCSAAARTLGAVNCIRRDGDDVVGENTDGDGFVRAMAADLGVGPAGRDVVVVGAGGAARAVVEAVARAGAASVTVVNRDRGRAGAAAALAGPRGRVGSPGDLGTTGLVVNATPLGMTAGDPLPLDPSLLGPDQVVVDLIYHPPRTPLLVAAEAAGALTANGLGMLVHQAAIAFEHWTGRPAPLAAMAAAVG